MATETITRRILRPVALALTLVALTASSGACGPLLDEILNCLKLDAHTKARDEARVCGIEPGRAVGQTFVTGDGVEQVFRIAVWQAFWHESWQPDESLVMTLWDSPQKRAQYGRFAIPYQRRMWEGAVPMFTVDARVQPNRSYYFELTVEVEPLRPAKIPREWLFAESRPGFAGGDGKIFGVGTARDDYPNGQAYVGGEPQNYDLWFQIHVRKKTDRDALYREAFDRFDLNYPPLKRVRDAVQKRDWDRAASELVRHFESRADLVPPERRQPKFDPDYDTRHADFVCEQKLLVVSGATGIDVGANWRKNIVGSTVTTVDLGPNWNHFALWPERGGVGLTRSGLRRFLAEAYAKTGNEKYAKAWNDMLTQLFIHLPSPLRAGVYKPDETIIAALSPGIAGGSMWSGLSIGARMAHGFAYYSWFVSSPNFTQDVRAAFIINLGEMADVLERQKGGGNWETQMADSLFDFGLEYPEFKGAKRWVQQGFQTLIKNALSSVRPDGVLQEPTINYHLLVMGRYASVIERARQLNLPVPDEMVKLTEKMHEFVMSSALPDSTLPLWGDANPAVTVESLVRGATLFKRDDFSFVATKGQKGTPPRLTSVGFPNGGFYYMRTGWQPDAHYLAIRCGPFGSHGHHDVLSLIASSFGKMILIDPGVYIYGTPESSELSGTKSHNTITVDNRDASSGQSDAWVTSERFDFFAGHNDGYRGLKDVRHHRRVWFLKPFDGGAGLWVVLDDVMGEGRHEAALRYRFARLKVQHDSALRQTWTNESDGNLLVRVLERPQTQMELSEGIAATSWDRLTKVPVASFRQQGKLPLAFTSLLLPFRGATPPTCEAQLIAVTPAAEGARAVWAKRGEEAFLIVANSLAALRDEPTALQLTLPDGRKVTMTAASATLRFAQRDNRWQPLSLHGVRVRSVVMDGENLLAQDRLNERVDVLF